MGFNALETAILGGRLAMGNLQSHLPGSQFCLAGEIKGATKGHDGLMEWMEKGRSLHFHR